MLMGVSILVISKDHSLLSLADWIAYVNSQPDLRINKKGYTARNPRTGTEIYIPSGEADSELLIGNQWEPFLRYEQGKLELQYHLDLETPTNPHRLKVAAVAKALRLAIKADAGDEPILW
jgi:hypothetical protein